MKMLGGAALMLLLFGLQANATLLTIDPDSYAPGTNLTQVSAAARISEWISDGSSARFEDVYALADNRAPSGANLFGHAAHPAASAADWRAGQYTQNCALGDCAFSFNVLRVDFTVATNYAQIWSTTDHFTFIDGAFFSAFRADNSLVGRCFLQQTENNGAIIGSSTLVGTGDPCGQVERTFACADPLDPVTCYYGQSLSVTSALDDIAYVVFGGNGFSGTRAFADRLSFDIPDAGSAGLLLGGLAVFGLLRRRPRAIA